MIRKAIITLSILLIVGLLANDLVFEKTIVIWQSHDDPSRNMTLVSLNRRFLSLEYGSLCPGCRNHIFGVVYHYALPTLLVCALLAVYPVTAFLRGPWRRYRRFARGLCIHCGYNLTGNVTGTCPECGKVTAVLGGPRATWRVVRSGSIVLAACFALLLALSRIWEFGYFGRDSVSVYTLPGRLLVSTKPSTMPGWQCVRATSFSYPGHGMLEYAPEAKWTVCLTLWPFVLVAAACALLAHAMARFPRVAPCTRYFHETGSEMCPESGTEISS